MKQYISVLKHTKLFRGIGENEIPAMLSCMSAKLRRYKKGEFVFRQGEYVRDISILVEGSLHIQKDDFWGNCNIISTIGVGDMFAEAYIAPDSGGMLNHVVAIEDSAVLLLDAKRILTVCSTACSFHALAVQNLVFALSEKNRKLVQKLGHMSNRSTREKLMSYLSEESHRQNSRTFVIPFNRQQLADYLSVDRSAMSNELCKMRDAGLLTFEKSRFTLL